jgi:hypothetical protein
MIPPQLALRLWDLWKVNRKYILLGLPLPVTSSLTHDIEDIDEKDLMELADNSEEEEEEDWGKGTEDAQDKPTKKRAKTDIPVSISKPSPAAASVKIKTSAPKTKASAPKTKSQPTFVKPLPLHTLSLKPKTAPAPSIESLIASIPTSTSSSSSLGNGAAGRGGGSVGSTPIDTFSIEVASWATVILHDPQLQGLFQQYLISLLHQLCERSQLPSQDDNLQNIFLLCQYNFFHDSLFHDLNQTLLRQILPLIMLLALDSSSDNNAVEFDETLIEKSLKKREGDGRDEGREAGSMNISQLYEFLSKTLSSLREKINQTAMIMSSNTTMADNLLGSIGTSASGM